jgi:hypothetical protein
MGAAESPAGFFIYLVVIVVGFGREVHGSIFRYYI